MIRVLMLHHAFPLMVRDMLVRMAEQADVQIDFVTVSDQPVYQSLTLGDRVTTHHLNVYKTGASRLTAAELYEYQAKSFIFTLRTARKIKYSLIHALGTFPECFTAYAFRGRFPYVLSWLPTDAAVAGRMTGGHAGGLNSLVREFVRSAGKVFDHRRNPSGFDPERAAAAYGAAYRELLSRRKIRSRRR